NSILISNWLNTLGLITNEFPLFPIIFPLLKIINYKKFMQKEDLQQISNLLDQKLKNNNEVLRKEIKQEIRQEIKDNNEVLLKKIEEKMDEKIEEFAIIVNSGFDGVNERFDRVENRLDRVENRLDNIEQSNEEIKLKLGNVAY
ncbi:hypothetical protein KKA77_02000, partial [Patescibacteria group bacterium]|nr:hypothetical protein [Patescibacteria group bacterium]